MTDLHLPKIFLLSVGSFLISRNEILRLRFVDRVHRKVVRRILMASIQLIAGFQIHHQVRPVDSVSKLWKSPLCRYFDAVLGFDGVVFSEAHGMFVRLLDVIEELLTLFTRTCAFI
ncbi:hypothetical protein CRM22_002786 [Opisthorchis felineus]|uniref:Uncharacterized protein n=1 Tax=Opisthorchis felineus TaxID=147828 RepID=A0A4S2M4E8_OPIFE|nr:hypothetical protein CRM22_002786 [Opisthorchis felineus]